MTKLIVTHEVSPFGSIGLAWRVQCDDGGWAESPRWGLLVNDADLDKALAELRAEGRVFEIEDRRAGRAI